MIQPVTFIFLAILLTPFCFEVSVATSLNKNPKSPSDHDVRDVAMWAVAKGEPLKFTKVTHVEVERGRPAGGAQYTLTIEAKDYKGDTHHYMAIFSVDHTGRERLMGFHPLD